MKEINKKERLYLNCKDSKGKKIYEGDKLQLISSLGVDRGIVIAKIEEYEDSEGYLNYGFPHYGYAKNGFATIID